MSSGENAQNPIRNPVLYPAELRGLTNDFRVAASQSVCPRLTKLRAIGIAGTGVHHPAHTRSSPVSADTFAA